MIVALMSAFIINAKAAEAVKNWNGDIGAKYTSEYYHRGEQLSNDAVQVSVGGSLKVYGVDLFVNHLSNLADASDEVDTNVLTGGFKTDVLNVVEASIGLLYRDTESTETRTDVYITLTGELLVDLAGTIARDINDDLYTYELAASKKFETSVADLKIGTIVGTTDVTSSNSRDYVGVCSEVSKSLTDAIDASVKLAWIDPDDAEDDTVVMAGLNFRF